MAQSQVLRRNNYDPDLLLLLAEGEYFCISPSLCVCKRERERVACVCQSLGGEAGAKAGENVCIPSFFQLDYGGRLKEP